MVDNLKVRLDLSPTEYPLDSLALAYKYCVNLEVRYESFDKLCGLLVRRPTETLIALNSARSKESRNFDCMHELIHYFVHAKQAIFNCTDAKNGVFQQDNYMEWQANEGAAQALVPYQEFIPLYVHMAVENKNEFYLFKTIDHLAAHFQVTDHVIFNRIRSLQYEIYQYFTLNIPINDLKILSHSKLQKYNLDSLKAEKKYCQQCYGIVEKGASFCKICGCALKILNYWEGLGYMKYDRIKVDPETSCALVCPICGNEETSLGDYCPICGQYLVNRCTGTYILHDDELGDKEFDCDTLQDGNARYCIKCGAKTTFFRDNLLKDWYSAQKELFAAQDNAESDTDEYCPF